MKNLLRSLSVLLCILLVNSVSFAQETPDPQDPKKQPLDKPTETKETPQKQDPNEPKTPIPNAVPGGTPAGQTPTSTQDGTFVNRFQDIPVNLYTGTPIIGFPIYTLTEPGGASVPLDLAYNASGMRGHDVSGWVGMNWSATFLFQISRIVRGIPDEGRYTLGSNFTTTARKGFYQYGLKADGDDENDSQPDLFFLNINGQSYKFSFDANKKAHFYPEADIDVQVTWTAQNSTAVGKFSNWVVTMPDGSKYTFAGIDVESSFEVEANAVINGNITYGTTNYGKYTLAETVISAWYCNKIETAFGHQTNFEYYSTTYSFFRVADQSTTTTNCTFNGIPKQINKIFVTSSTLFKISNQTHVVEINKGGWTSYIDANGDERWYISNTYPARSDLDTHGQYPTNSSNAKALHKITVYAKDDPTKVFEWKFNYDYNYGNDPSNLFGIFAGYNYSTIGYTHQRRFKLRSIEEPNGNRYTFKYYDDSFTLPSRLTQGIDHWGYLNGALGETTLIGEDAFRPCANNQFGNKTATNGWSQYGTLTAISHSTGGTTFLEYENHKARNYTSIIGGSRVKKITYLDSISNLKNIKRYDYQQVNGQSSGFLCLKPVYHFDDKTNYTGAPDQYWHSGLYQQLLSESGRPAVGYSRVKETVLSSDGTDSLGYTISEFLQPTTEINITEIVTTNCRYLPPVPPNPPVYVCDTVGKYIRPWKWNPFHENTVGVSSRVAVYGKNNQLLSEKSSVYTEEQLQVSIPYFFQYHSFRLVDKNYNFEQYYGEFYNTYRLTSDTTKMYSQDGTNPVVNYSNQEFPIQAKHNQVIKTTTKDSYGSIITNTMKYPLDFQFGPGINSNVEAQGVQALQQKHILTAVVESITKVRQDINSNDVFITGAAYQTFYKADSTGVKAGMPKSNFVLENLPRLSMTEANYDPMDDAFTRSSDYDLKATINAYTTIGLPMQRTPRFGPVSKTNYDATYPTLPISQISNVGQPSEQTTTMTYGKILYGVSKQKGANNLEVNSEYYADGKLKQQTDKDGNVLKHLQYVYRRQADSDPHVTTNTGYNRVITRIPRFATTDALNLGVDSCMITIQYFDGSGRIVQNIGFRASPNKKDLISGVVDYDKFNRPKRTWLSVESTQNTGALLDTASVKSIARAFYQDQKPYSEVLEYENSPMNRVFKAYGVGKVWQDSSKYVKMDYQTATGSRRLFVNNDDDFMANGTYPNYELAKSISTDERGSQVIEYKDKAGNVVQKDVQVDNTTNYLRTLFCFDPAGRLRYIFPPKAVNLLGTSSVNVESWSGFNENVYAFHYDGRGRVYESKKPGIGWEKTVFNRLNQAVMSQDSDELAKNNTWNYAQTDGQGRGVRDGQMQLPATYTRAYLQGLFDAFVDNQQFEERDTIQTSSFRKYTNRSFPTALRTYINDATWKNIHYFDDYKFRYNDGSSGMIAQYGFQLNPYNSTAYSATNPKGLMTGGLHKIDNFGDFAFPSAVYYDDKNRPTQSIVYQDLYARNQSDTKYNFVGESLINQMIYRKNGDADRTIIKENILDHVGRAKDFYYTLKEGTVDKVPRLKMVSLLHDNIGRVKTKFIQPNENLKVSKATGNWLTSAIWQNNTIPATNSYVVISKGDTVTIPASTTVTAATLFDAGVLKFLSNAKLQMSSLGNSGKPSLQSIDYSYNVRGQMRGINLDANGNPQTSADKLFSYKLDYHEDGRYFDGSISKMTWKSSVTTTGVSAGTKSYTYYYDRAGRLTSAISGASEENFSIPRVSYDVNGNITFLSRMAKVPFNGNFLTTKVDSLDYQHFNGGNKLRSVTDNAIRATLGGFKNGSNSGDDYAYYADGKLQKDLNRNISLIEYNYLDLVSKVKFANNDSIQYFYTTTGEKRRTERTIGGQKSYTFYDGEMIYTATGNLTSLNDYKLSEIQNPEGRYVNGKLEYSYTDHLGNLRLSYKDSLGTAFVTQGYAFDAWGLELKLHRYQFSGTTTDRYTWQGKEDLEADNLEGWSDFGWRIEDRTLGRWFTPDPEDQFESISSYALCGNNPISNIDPDGRFFFLAAGIGAAFGLFDGLSQGKKGMDLFGSVFSGAVIGGLSAGFGTAVGGATKGLGTVLSGALSGATAGGISGGFTSAMNGGNFGNGFLSGAAFGGLTGGLVGGTQELFGHKIYGTNSIASGDPQKLYSDGSPLLDEVTVFGKNVWNGFSRGLSETAGFFSSLKTAEGWSNLGYGTLETLRLISPSMSGLSARAKVSSSIIDYSKDIPNMSSAELGNDIGYGTEKFGELLVTRKVLPVSKLKMGYKVLGKASKFTTRATIDLQGKLGKLPFRVPTPLNGLNVMSRDIGTIANRNLIIPFGRTSPLQFVQKAGQ